MNKSTINVQDLIDRLDDGETVMDAVDDTIAALEDLRSYVDELQQGIDSLLRLINEHGSNVLKAHATQIADATKTMNRHKVK